MSDADTRPEPTAKEAFGENSGPPIYAGIVYLGFLMVATLGILLHAGDVF